MNVTELLSVEPKAAAYELKRGGKYLVCMEKQMPQQLLENLQKLLGRIGQMHGIEFVGILNFVPRIFELEPEKEK